MRTKSYFLQPYNYIQVKKFNLKVYYSQVKMEFCI